MKFNRVKTVAVVLLASSALFACGGDSEASEEEVCGTLEEVASAIEAGDASADPTEAIGGLVTAMESFESIAPSDLKDDASTMLDGMKQLQEVSSSDSEPSEDDMAFLEDEKFDKAADNVGEYAEKNCDIDIG